MRYPLLYCLFALLLLSCQPTKQGWEKLPEKLYPKFEVATLSPGGSIRRPIAQSLGLNHNLDSLAKLGNLDHLCLIDMQNLTILLDWSPFIGRIFVEKKSADHYQIKHRIAEQKEVIYDLEIFNGYYIFSQQEAPKISLPFKMEELDQLHEKMRTDSICRSKDWDIAGDCWDQISAYQSMLFSALLAGDTTYKEAFLQLPENHTLVLGGEAAESLSGDTHLLLLMGILDPVEIHELMIYKNYCGLVDKVYWH